MKPIKPCRDPWKGTMTARERFLRQMTFQPVDRCFNMEFGYWDECFTQWPLFSENGISNNDKADRFFSFDRFEAVYPNNWLSPPFEKKIIGETDKNLILINEEGLTAEVPKSGSSIPHYISASIVTPEDWKRCKEERFRLDDVTRVPNPSDIRALHPADRDYPLGIDCGSLIGKVRDMLTFEGLAYACYDYPDMVEEMVETCCQMAERALDILLPEIDFDYACGWEDICFKNGPIVSPSFFKEVVAPRYKRISKRLKEHGIKVYFIDCDGDVRPILPYLIENGVNCLFPYEVNSCAHPAELCAEYGKDLLIMGGVDKMELGKGPEAIKAYLESLEPLVARGGYIPFCDHRCPPNVKPEDYLYYLDLKEAMFGIKREERA